MGDWKPADTPPNDASPVLCTCRSIQGELFVRTGYWCGRHWHANGLDRVEAWMELPKPWGGGL